MQSTGQHATFDLGEAIEVLKATPTVLRGLLAELPQQWLHFQEDSEAWSPHTVLIHFIHNERTNWIPRARVILSEADVREFPPFRQLPENFESDRKSASELLNEFAELREANLASLTEFNLKPSDLDREGVHPVLGTVKLGQLLSTWVVHDMNHIHQIAKTLAKRYLIGVGPWRKNLAILDI